MGSRKERVYLVSVCNKLKLLRASAAGLGPPTRQYRLVSQPFASHLKSQTPEEYAERAVEEWANQATFACPDIVFILLVVRDRSHHVVHVGHGSFGRGPAEPFPDLIAAMREEVLAGHPAKAMLQALEGLAGTDDRVEVTVPEVPANGGDDNHSAAAHGTGGVSGAPGEGGEEPASSSGRDPSAVADSLVTGNDWESAGAAQGSTEGDDGAGPGEESGPAVEEAVGFDVKDGVGAGEVAESLLGFDGGDESGGGGADAHACDELGGEDRQRAEGLSQEAGEAPAVSDKVTGDIDVQAEHVDGGEPVRDVQETGDASMGVVDEGPAEDLTSEIEGLPAGLRGDVEAGAGADVDGPGGQGEGPSGLPIGTVDGGRSELAVEFEPTRTGPERPSSMELAGRIRALMEAWERACDSGEDAKVADCGVRLSDWQLEGGGAGDPGPKGGGASEGDGAVIGGAEAGVAPFGVEQGGQQGPCTTGASEGCQAPDVKPVERSDVRATGVTEAPGAGPARVERGTISRPSLLRWLVVGLGRVVGWVLLLPLIAVWRLARFLLFSSAGRLTVASVLAAAAGAVALLFRSPRIRAGASRDDDYDALDRVLGQAERTKRMLQHGGSYAPESCPCCLRKLAGVADGRGDEGPGPSAGQQGLHATREGPRDVDGDASRDGDSELGATRSGLEMAACEEGAAVGQLRFQWGDDAGRHSEAPAGLMDSPDVNQGRRGVPRGGTGHEGGAMGSEREGKTGNEGREMEAVPADRPFACGHVFCEDCVSGRPRKWLLRRCPACCALRALAAAGKLGRREWDAEWLFR